VIGIVFLVQRPRPSSTGLGRLDPYDPAHGRHARSKHRGWSHEVHCVVLQAKWRWLVSCRWSPTRCRNANSAGQHALPVFVIIPRKFRNRLSESKYGQICAVA